MLKDQLKKCLDGAPQGIGYWAMESRGTVLGFWCHEEDTESSRWLETFARVLGVNVGWHRESIGQRIVLISRKRQSVLFQSILESGTCNTECMNAFSRLGFKPLTLSLSGLSSEQIMLVVNLVEMLRLAAA